MSMKIGIDVDGCLANFTKGYAALIRDIAGRDLLTDEDISNPKCWLWDEAAGYTKEEVGECWRLINGNEGKANGFWYTLDSFEPGFNDFWFVLEEVCALHDVYFITHRITPSAKLQTEEWLKDRAIETPTVLIAGNKLPIIQALELDVFIDDKPSTLFEVANKWDGRLYKVSYRYNEGFPGTPVASVREFLQLEGLV
jgi:hypothetical protein